jgi:hypothetical protein
MNTELIPADQKTAMEAIEQTAKDYGIMSLDGKNEMEKTLILATGMEKLKGFLTPQIMKPIMALQNSTLGFRTDKEGGYPEEVVRDVTAEALLRGFRMVGNEVNIIATRFYAAKDGCRRLVIKWPGLTEFELHMSFPRDDGGKCLVEAIASWKLNGIEDSLEKRGKEAISIRRNSGMIDDAILGKAERKMYAAVLSKLSNFIMPEGEVDQEFNGAPRPPKVKRSSLNDYADEQKEQPKPPADPAEQDILVLDYKAEIDRAETPLDIQGLQKRAAMAGTLSAESLSKVNAYANERKRKMR